MTSKSPMKRKLMIAAIAIVASTIMGTVVMLLWNAILPHAISGVQLINFWQALGILILSKILFGGFRGRCGAGFGSRKWAAMKEKYASMSPMEREKFTAEWKNRCNRWGNRQQQPIENDQ